MALLIRYACLFQVIKGSRILKLAVRHCARQVVICIERRRNLDSSSPTTVTDSKGEKRITRSNKVREMNVK